MEREKEDAGRNIEYPSLAVFMTNLRYSAPIIDVWLKNKYRYGNAIGHSWLHRGAHKFL